MCWGRHALGESWRAGEELSEDISEMYGFQHFQGRLGKWGFIVIVTGHIPFFLSETILIIWRMVHFPYYRITSPTL